MDEIEIALEDCLQQITTGRSSVGQCLSRYPRYAAELRPMLEAAVRVRQGRDVRPSGAMRERTRARLAEHMAAHPHQPRKRRRPVPGFALTLLALALAFFAVGTAFAQGALPGQALYNWKLSAERAWRAASFNPLSVDLSLADRRTDELITVCKDPSGESDGIAAYNEVLNRLAAESDGPDNGQVMGKLEEHQQKLAQAGIHVPVLDEIVSHSKSMHGKGKGSGRP